jgi:protein O-mannosyl-transferase
VTLPFVLLLLDYWPLGRLSPTVVVPPPAVAQPKKVPGQKARKPGETPPPIPATAAGETGAVPAGIAWSRLGPLIREKLPLFALAAGASLMIYLVQAETGIVKSVADFPFPARLTNAVFSYAAYLFKAIYPLHLAIFYPHPRTALPLWQAAGAGALLVLITLAVLRRARPYLVVGWLWYLGTLVPVIGLVQVGLQGMADRYTYIPLIGLFIMITWGLPELDNRWPFRKAALISAAAAGLAALTALTWFQVRTWQSDFTLYSHAVRVTSGNYWAEYNLGLTLAAEENFNEALDHFGLAIRYRPDYADAYLNIGTIRARQGNLAEAEANFSRVLALQPGHAEANRNLILLMLQQGRPAEAVDRLEALLRNTPDDPELWFLAGRVQTRSGSPAEAESAYERAIRLRPSYAEAHNNLGILLARQGRLPAAIDQFREALRIRPDYREAAKNLEMALGESRR